MTSISDLSLDITPFNLKVTIDQSATVPRIRGAEVVLPEITIEDEEPHSTVLFQDVLECICQQINDFGLQLSFEIEISNEPKKGKRLKRFELSKRVGQRLEGGHDSIGFVDGTEVWQWSATYLPVAAAKTKLRTGTGRTFDDLLSIRVTELRHVVFSYGVMPSS